MRRGDIRTAILAVLAESPGHGYDIMSRLQEKSGGMWRPSAGSVYPTLQQLEDEGLVTSADADGKRVYTATSEGTAEAERRIEEAGGEPWAESGTGIHPGHLFRSIGTLTMAAKQIVAAGTPAQLAAAVKVTDNARKELYRILGDDTFDAVDDSTTSSDPE
jgi:DNA-binding PadR family transcriptional regulator